MAGMAQFLQAIGFFACVCVLLCAMAVSMRTMFNGPGLEEWEERVAGGIASIACGAGLIAMLVLLDKLPK